ncbi:MAG: PKD domain-containing protein [Gammaproteobacteria bacterium]
MSKLTRLSTLGPVILSLSLATGLASATGQKKLDAGPDITVSVLDTVTLSGTVNDREPAYLSIGWMKNEGPGQVTFDDRRSTTTNVTFSQPGQYVLTLGGYDGSIAYDEVVITVTP